jgi:hypothetical protein
MRLREVTVMKTSTVVRTLLAASAVLVLSSPPSVAVTLTATDLSVQFFGALPGDVDLELTNATGQTWTDLHLRSQGPGAIQEDSYDGPGTPDYGSPSAILNTTIFFTLDIFDLNVADADTLSLSFNHFCVGEACSLGAVYSVLPTVQAEPVESAPEPGTLLLFGSGLLGLTLRHRRK